MDVIAGGTALDLRANRTGGEVGPCTCDQTGTPVNTRSGNFWTSVTDLSVTTPGPELTWSRIYASQAITDTTSVFGYGWQAPYTARLLLPTSGPDAGRAIIVSGRANEIRFTPNNGQYVPDPGVTSTLTSTLVGASTIYTQTLRNQQQLIFDGATGRLKTIRDTQGRSVTLTYTGSPSRLSSIMDVADTSRVLTLGYDANGHISSVGDGAGRSVTYSYTDGNDNLTGVTDVMLHATTYTYATPANHLLTKIERTRNSQLELIEQITYDTQTPPRVSSQLLQDGRTIQFQYVSNKTVLTTTRPNGQSEIQEDVYTSANTLAGITINNQAVQAVGFDANFNPSAVGDGEGHATQTNFNTNGLPTMQTNALGQTAKAQYDGLNRPLYVTDTLGITTAYQYDQYNNVTRVTAGITTTSTLRATTYYTYTYNVRYPGDSLLSKIQRPDSIIVRYDYPTSGSITAKGQVSSMTVGDGLGTLAQVTAYQYDAQGRVVLTTAASGVTGLARADKTVYNADNTVAQTIRNFKDGIFTATKPDEDLITTYGYDDYGRQIWVKDVLGHYDVTYYKPNGQVDWTTRNLSGYSGGALPAMAPDYSPSAPDVNITTKYGYDDLGRTTLVTQTGILTGTFNPNTLQFSTAISRVIKTEYDALSRPVTMTLDLGGINARSLTYYDGTSSPIWQRDAYGRWTKMDYDALSRPITTTVNYQNGSVGANEPSDQDLISTMHYDIAGRVDRQIDNWVDGSFGSTDTITDRLILYQYDTLGRQTTTTQNATTRTGMDLNRITQTLFDPAKGWALGQKTYQSPAPANSVTRWSSQQYDTLILRKIRGVANPVAPQPYGYPK